MCFEITINDDTPGIAGLGGISVLSAVVTFVSARNDLECRVGGLVSRERHDNEHLEWLDAASGSVKAPDSAVPAA
jgi:hypothetical protein